MYGRVEVDGWVDRGGRVGGLKSFYRIGGRRLALLGSNTESLKRVFKVVILL